MNRIRQHTGDFNFSTLFGTIVIYHCFVFSTIVICRCFVFSTIVIYHYFVFSTVSRVVPFAEGFVERLDVGIDPVKI